MIYLSIPSGMVFKKVTCDKGDNSIDNTRDCFVDTKEGAVIELQDLIKEALRTNKGHKKSIQLKEFTIHLKKPPNTDESFLAYSPNHNGKYPTEIEPKLVKGKDARKYDPKQYTSYGSFWYRETVLTSERQLEIKEKRLAQKNDRRHTGDNPKPT